MSSLTPTIQPTSGVVGLPDGVKEAGQRVDFKADKFTLAVETKGYRLAWSRAAPCPCTSVNDQTEQPDPNCSVCEGSGWFYFAPSESVSANAGTLSDLQTKVIADKKAGVIRGLMTTGTADFDPYNKIGFWQDGQMMLTVRPENKVGYYDRIINLDDDLVYAETIDATSASQLALRYPAKQVNLLRSLDTVFVPDVNFDLVDGEIRWLTGQPASGTKLIAHYLTYPVWLITHHPHIVRSTLVKQKNPNPTTPQGDSIPLAIQAVVKYEFLP